MNTFLCDHFLKNQSISQKGEIAMRIMVTINEHPQVYEIFNISDVKNGCLLAPITPHGFPIVIHDVFDPESFLYRIAVHGWADLSMFPACYLEDNTDENPSEDDSIEPEIKSPELEL